MSTATKRVLIVGMPRSGTTLLASFLSAQRRASFITEYVPVFFAAAKQLGVRLDERLSPEQRRVALAMARDQFLRLRHPVLVKPDEFHTLDDLHRQILAEVAADDDIAVGHKLVLAPGEVEELIRRTDCLAVLLLRDPRDAALSFWFRTGGGVEHYLEDYKGMVRLSRTIDPSRLVTLSFEDLLRSPEETLAPLGRALGLELDVDVAGLGFVSRVDAAPTAFEENSAFGDVTERFAREPVGRYRQHLDSEVVRFAAWFCASEIRQLGYPPSPPELVRPVDQARFRLRLVSRRASKWLVRAAERSTEALEAVAPPIRHR